MANNADPDQLASLDLELHCSQKQDISVLAGQGLRILILSVFYTPIFIWKMIDTKRTEFALEGANFLFLE